MAEPGSNVKSAGWGQIMALFLITGGTYLIWCGITDRHPVDTLKAALRGSALPDAGSWNSSDGPELGDAPEGHEDVAPGPLDPTYPGGGGGGSTNPPII